jgi:hypothetical protein
MSPHWTPLKSWEGRKPHSGKDSIVRIAAVLSNLHDAKIRAIYTLKSIIGE